MSTGNFVIRHGVPSSEQETSMMNATLSDHRDNLTISVSVTPRFPNDLDLTDPTAVEAHLLATFIPLQQSGWDIEISAGPTARDINV